MGIRKMQVTIAGAAQRHARGRQGPGVDRCKRAGSRHGCGRRSNSGTWPTGLRRSPNPTSRAAAAVKIFGASGTKMLPLLTEGPPGIDRFEQRARELGLVTSTDSRPGRLAVQPGAGRFAPTSARSASLSSAVRWGPTSSSLPTGSPPPPSRSASGSTTIGARAGAIQGGRRHRAGRGRFLDLRPHPGRVAGGLGMDFKRRPTGGHARFRGRDGDGRGMDRASPRPSRHRRALGGPATAVGLVCCRGAWPWAVISSTPPASPASALRVAQGRLPAAWPRTRWIPSGRSATPWPPATSPWRPRCCGPC